MSGVAFTAGPWRSEIDNVFAGPVDDSLYIADCAPFGSPVEGRPEEIANANLIASAPDLYAALVALEREFFPSPHPDDFSEWNAARAAIAKARGEAS